MFIITSPNRPIPFGPFSTNTAAVQHLYAAYAETGHARVIEVPDSRYLPKVIWNGDDSVSVTSV